MKFSFLFLSILSFSAKAEVFTHKISSSPAREIKIEKLNGLHVNIECIQNKNECLSLVKTSVKNSKTKKESHVLGNPASDFCIANNGKSEILKDKNNNEYDYCIFKDKYFVDSWNFYSLNKK
jgi:putative hemolysin